MKKRPNQAFPLTFGVQMKARIITYGLLIAAIGAFIWFLEREDSGAISRESVARHFACELMPKVIERLHADLGRYPTTDEGLSVLLHAPKNDALGWRGPYLWDGRIPKDPWGRDYCYRVPARKEGLSYEVFSLGADGKLSDDDIGNFSK